MTPNTKKAGQLKKSGGLTLVQRKALAHPLRHRIQIVLDTREASPTELSEVLDEDFYNVCYHVGKLKEAECIQLVDTDKRRGGTQHFYRAIVRPILDTVDAEDLPRLLREDGSAAVVPLIFKDLNESIEAGAFDSRPARSLLRMGMIVDEEGFEETGEAAMAFLDALSDIQSRSANRLSAQGREGFNIATATLVFPKAPPASDSSD